jgi:hypothetical protein
MSGILYETDNFISSVVNRGGVAGFELFGGNPVVQGGVNATDKELYNLTKYATGGKKVVIPFVNTKPLDTEGFPMRSMDRRNWVYRTGQVVNFFVPEASKATEFAVIGANIVGGTTAVGKFLEPTNASLLFTSNDTQTASVPSFEVIDTFVQKFNDGSSFDDTEVTVYVVATRYNG